MDYYTFTFKEEDGPSYKDLVWGIVISIINITVKAIEEATAWFAFELPLRCNYPTNHSNHNLAAVTVTLPTIPQSPPPVRLNSWHLTVYSAFRYSASHGLWNFSVFISFIAEAFCFVKCFNFGNTICYVR